MTRLRDSGGRGELLSYLADCSILSNEKRWWRRTKQSPQRHKCHTNVHKEYKRDFAQVFFVSLRVTLVPLWLGSELLLGFELLLVDLVLRNLVGDAAARKAGDLRALADVPAGAAQRADDVALLEERGQFGQLLRQ